MTATMDPIIRELDVLTGRAQYYAFAMPGDELVWVEAFDDLGHWVAPSPFTSLPLALEGLDRIHPEAIVDAFIDETVCPLELDGAVAMASGRVRCSGEITGDRCTLGHPALIAGRR